MASTGEGSRGGKIIGHTKSGKPIYDSAGRRIVRSANVGANAGQAIGTLAHIAGAVGVASGVGGKLGKVARAVEAVGWTKSAALGAGAGAALFGGVAAASGGEFTGPGITDNPFGLAVAGIGAYKLGKAATITKSAAAALNATSRVVPATTRKARLAGRGIAVKDNVIRVDFGSRNPFKKGT